MEKSLKSNTADKIHNNQNQKNIKSSNAADSPPYSELSSSSLDDKSDSNDEEQDIQDESEDVGSSEEIDVDFEAQAMCEGDFHGIRQLLKQSLVTTNIDLSELTEILIAQKDIGSTIKVVDDEEKVVYGVSSVVSLAQHKDKTCMKQLTDFVRKTARLQSEDLSKRIEDLLNKNKVGFLINERFINIPAQIALPLYETLRVEIDDIAAKEKTFQFSHFLMVSKSLKYTDDDNAPAKKKKKVELSKAVKDEDLMFVNMEDSLFLKNSILSFSYSVTDAVGTSLGGDWESGETMDTYRTVLIIDSSKLDTIIDILKASDAR